MREDFAFKKYFKEVLSYLLCSICELYMPCVTTKAGLADHRSVRYLWNVFFHQTCRLIKDPFKN